ncbi:MAG: hypothetical protein JO041_05860 [Acidobacteria bacterium]|nr:hypothetical protein [Acidobacteriota bacterium]
MDVGVVSRLTLVMVAGASFAATPATFRGRIIEAPDPAQAVPGTILVMGRNGLLRKVEVGQARVVYSEYIPPEKRQKRATDSLKAGAEIRVLAEENGDGLWRARQIEILALPESGQFHAGGKGGRRGSLGPVQLPPLSRDDTTTNPQAWPAFALHQ